LSAMVVAVLARLTSLPLGMTPLRAQAPAHPCHAERTRGISPGRRYASRCQLAIHLAGTCSTNLWDSTLASQRRLHAHPKLQEVTHKALTVISAQEGLGPSSSRARLGHRSRQLALLPRMQLRSRRPRGSSRPSWPLRNTRVGQLELARRSPPTPRRNLLCGKYMCSHVTTLFRPWQVGHLLSPQERWPT